MAKAKKEEPKKPEVEIRTTRDFRLKDNPPQRRVQFIPCMQVFGFLPETIVIEKLPSQNNRIRVSAIIPKKKLAEEEAKIKAELKKKEEKTKKAIAKKGKK